MSILQIVLAAVTVICVLYGLSVLARAKRMVESRAWIVRAGAGMGESARLVMLGHYFAAPGVGKYLSQAAICFKLAAELDDADAQTCLGLMYKRGQGVLQDYEKAVALLRQAANQGNATAQNSLGSMYADGEGVPKDPTEGLKWFRLAAEQGDANGQFNVGLMYEVGWGVPKDPVEAHRWMSLAHEQGFGPARRGLERVKNMGLRPNERT